jgi:hypothetical protein
MRVVDIIIIILITNNTIKVLVPLYSCYLAYFDFKWKEDPRAKSWF